MRSLDMRNPVTATAGALLFFSVGVLGGIFLIAVLPGMPWASLIVPTPGGGVEHLDLAAQRSMAAAAWWMVAITAISSGVGAAGLWLIFATLREAKRSADAAEAAVRQAEETTKAALISAEHAAKSVEVAREMGQAQVRAYLVVTEVAASYTHPDNRFRLRVRFMNSGQSPARFISIQCEVVVLLANGDTADRQDTKYTPDLGALKDGEKTFAFDMPEVAGSSPPGWTDCRLTVTTKYRDVFRDWPSDKARFLMPDRDSPMLYGQIGLDRTPEAVSRRDRG